MIVRNPVTIGPATWDWSRTYVFGVVNVTPDSFSDGGQFFDREVAVARGRALIDAGADALDIGGESTRPGSEPVPVDEEKRRVLPVVERLAAHCRVPISVDTYKAEVAEAAVAAGASVINDVSGLRLDEAMADTVARTGAAVILGHLRGKPATMQDDIRFDDVVGEVIEELRASVQRAIQAGVAGDRIWVDPGIGFGKTAEQSLALVAATDRIVEALGYPVMVGTSRKSFIGEVTGLPAMRRIIGTCAASAIAVMGGAEALRLHDVAELRSGVQVADAIRRAKA